MKNHFLYLFLLCISFFLIVACAAGKETDNIEELVKGFWSGRFPVSDETYGYTFLSDHSFIYSYADYFLGYEKTIGKWKVEKNKLFVYPMYNKVWKDKWEKVNDYFYKPGEGNISYVEKNKLNIWEEIGSLEGFEVKWKEFVSNKEKWEKDKKNIEVPIPARNKFYFFSNGKLNSKNQIFFKINTLETLDMNNINKIFKWFNDDKKKDE